LKGAVWTDINKIEIQNIPTPTPKAGEVLVLTGLVILIRKLRRKKVVKAPKKEEDKPE